MQGHTHITIMTVVTTASFLIYKNSYSHSIYSPYFLNCCLTILNNIREDFE